MISGLEVQLPEGVCPNTGLSFYFEQNVPTYRRLSLVIIADDIKYTLIIRHGVNLNARWTVQNKLKIILYKMTFVVIICVFLKMINIQGDSPSMFIPFFYNNWFTKNLL